MSRHGSQHAFIPARLDTCDYAFLRQDVHRPRLAPPYEEPFRVLRRDKKTFDIKIGTTTKIASMVRLKPVHVVTSMPLVSATRSQKYGSYTNASCWVPNICRCCSLSLFF